MKEGKNVHLVSDSLHKQGFLTSSCLPWWIQFLVDKLTLYRHLHYTKNRSVERYLPYEILVNIFSRLPAECVLHCGEISKPLRLLTTTPSFVNLHFRRANPIIAFCYFDKKLFSPSNVQVNFTDEVAKRITTKPTWFTQYSKPDLYCSLNGFLLFVQFLGGGYHIWNPVTGQNKTFKERYYPVCGFYCHQPTMEYRVLFILKPKDGPFEFCIHGLLSERVRWITNFTHPPTRVRSPVNLNGILHWMVDDKSYKSALGDKPECSNSIILFNTTGEEFSTIPHPGDECGLRKKHDMMELMDMEGNLSFCDSTSHRNLDIWVLEDYENRFWVKRYSIEIEPLLEICGIQFKYGSHVNLGGFYIYNKELLLKVLDNDLILYNLQTGTIRRVGGQTKKDLRVVAVPHIDTLFLDIF